MPQVVSSFSIIKDLILLLFSASALFVSLLVLLKSLRRVEFSELYIVRDQGEAKNPSVSLQSIKGNMYDIHISVNYRASLVSLFKEGEKYPYKSIMPSFFSTGEDVMQRLKEPQVIRISALKENDIIQLEFYRMENHLVDFKFKDKYNNEYFQRLTIDEPDIENPFNFKNLISERQITKRTYNWIA